MSTTDNQFWSHPIARMSLPKSTLLGRLEEFDQRSRNFPIRALLGAPRKRSYTWRCDTWLNQGVTSSCVGHAWAHELIARPSVVDANSDAAMTLYHRAQDLDQWPGTDYDGTSVLAGAKAVAERGHIAEYRWAFNLDDLIEAVGFRGPAVLGLNWYEGMFYPDTQGIIRPSGPVAGGHAVMCNGVNITRRLFRIHNSWGNTWGKGGDCFITFDDMERLLDENGEACIPTLRNR